MFDNKPTWRFIGCIPLFGARAPVCLRFLRCYRSDKINSRSRAPVRRPVRMKGEHLLLTTIKRRIVVIACYDRSVGLLSSSSVCFFDCRTFKRLTESPTTISHAPFTKPYLCSNIIVR